VSLFDASAIVLARRTVRPRSSQAEDRPMLRTLTALSFSLVLSTPAMAQSFTGARVGIAPAHTEAVAPFSPLAARSPANARLVPADEAPPPPRRRSTLHSFMSVGAVIGLFAGLGYGIYAAAGCDQCFPGTQVLLVPISTMGGAVAGAGTGALVWAISRPFSERGFTER
jgi:hypothetical protein